MTTNLTKAPAPLSDSTGNSITELYAGVNWSGIGKTGKGIKLGRFKLGGKTKETEINLDLTVVSLGHGLLPVEFVDGNNPTDRAKAMKHSGDNTTGADSGDDDDEFVTVNLAKLPNAIQAVLFTVTAFSANNFGDTRSVAYTLGNGSRTNAFVTDYLPIVPEANAGLIALITRDNSPSGWSIRSFENDAHLLVPQHILPQDKWREIVKVAEEKNLITA